MANMIKGRSPPDIRAILKIQDFRGLAGELRQTCYEHLDMSVETLIAFHKAVEGEDIFKEFTEWTSHLLAIVSPIQDYLNQLVPGADVAMWRPRDNTLRRRVDSASQENGDYVCLRSTEFWRVTHHLDLRSDSFPISRIEVDDKVCLLLRKWDDNRFLVVCKRDDLAVFSRNWMMLWPITGIHIRPCDSIPDLDGAMNLFKPVGPEICYIHYNDNRESTLPETLRTREILRLLNQVANQEWNGYPPKTCLGYARDFITSMFKWHSDWRERYCCGRRFENPLSAADREKLEQLVAKFDKMLEVMQAGETKSARTKRKVMQAGETKSARTERKVMQAGETKSARTKRKERRDNIKKRLGESADSAMAE
jgi:hypothetical protein